MNNEQGATLLARVKAGDLVTIRELNGGMATGKVYAVGCDGAAAWLRDARNHIRPVTLGNIISIRPRD